MPERKRMLVRGQQPHYGYGHCGPCDYATERHVGCVIGGGNVVSGERYEIGSMRKAARKRVEIEATMRRVGVILADGQEDGLLRELGSCGFEALRVQDHFELDSALSTKRSQVGVLLIDNQSVIPELIDVMGDIPVVMIPADGAGQTELDRAFNTLTQGRNGAVTWYVPRDVMAVAEALGQLKEMVMAQY